MPHDTLNTAGRTCARKPGWRRLEELVLRSPPATATSNQVFYAVESCNSLVPMSLRSFVARPAPVLSWYRTDPDDLIFVKSIDKAPHQPRLTSFPGMRRLNCLKLIYQEGRRDNQQSC